MPKWLLEHGVSAGQLKVISYGEDKPADRGHTTWNRRVKLDFREGAA